jgi:hypothetical protein
MLCREGPAFGAGGPDSRVNSMLSPGNLQQQSGSPRSRHGSAGMLTAMRDNPARLMSSLEAPLLCCAWAAGCTKGRAVVGSAAGWLSVVDVEELLPDTQPVSVNSTTATYCTLCVWVSLVQMVPCSCAPQQYQIDTLVSVCSMICGGRGYA